MSNPNYGLTEPPPMWCPRCGERFNRMNTATSHICSPNNTGFNPGDAVRVGTATGHVRRVDRDMVEVYIRSSYRSHWFSPADLKRVT